MTKAAPIETRIEGLLSEIKPIVTNIESVEAKVNKQIAKLEKQIKEKKDKLEKDTRTSRELLELKERKLQKILEGFEFPEKTKTLRFDVGEVSAKKLPDKIVIEDTDKTVAKLKSEGLDETCVKTVETVIKKAVENLDEKTQKKCGITVDDGIDRYYYSIESSVKTSTGLAYE